MRLYSERQGREAACVFDLCVCSFSSRDRDAILLKEKKKLTTSEVVKSDRGKKPVRRSNSSRIRTMNEFRSREYI